LKEKKLFRESEAIFRAGVAAVNPEELVKRVLDFSGRNLTVDGDRYSLDHFRRIYLLGAGKAAGREIIIPRPKGTLAWRIRAALEE